ncbi:MAG: chloride channel protein, partial [Duncaniella sp.]|nr:chloride channel protein [Duncaniella sp.]
MISVLDNIGHNCHNAFMALLVWRERHIKEKTFVIILALIVGIFAGVAALVLKTLIHLISSTLTSRINIDEGSFLYLIYPLIGILLTVLYVKYI